jgi:ketosteroid isomerase-like protein
MATTSEERIALAQGGMDAFNDRDVPRMLAALADDVEVYASPEMANAGRFTGHDGFVSWITAWVDAWEEVTAEVIDNSPVGDRHVVTSVHQEGRGREGIQVSMDLAFLFEVNDEGKCSFLAMVPSAQEARQLAESREASG